MQDYEGKVAVITGGASGIGLDIAKALAAKGCHSVIADLDADACAAAAEQIVGAAEKKIISVGKKCDVTDKKQIIALADFAWDKFGAVDLLFNNAGVGGANGPAWQVDERDVRWVFEVNFFGNWNVCMEFCARFVKQGTPAHICNTASENSLGWPMPYLAAYNGTKAAVMGYSGMLRQEVPDFIGVSILCPGLTRTNIGKSGTLRPKKYGGPLPPRPPLDAGYDADTVGNHTLEHISKGAFFIVPHYAARHLAEERNNEIIAAFDAQTEWSEDWQQYDSRALFERLREAARAKRQE